MMAQVYRREADGSRGVAIDMDAQARLGEANRPLREAQEAALERLREVQRRVAHPRIGCFGSAGGAHRKRRP